MMFSPLKIKDLVLKNRIVMPPMCMYMAIDGFVNDFHIIHYATRAIGQVGLIIVESTAVLDNGQISEQDLGIWDDKFIPGLAEITKAVHDYGGKIGIQLSHAGRKAKDAQDMYAPSALSYGNYKVPRTMTLEEIKEVVKAFGKAAKRAKAANFDFIEIHGAHGYLLNQFISPISNKREDEYGGDFKNRNRILKEVIEEVRKQWPKEKPLGIRVSATEYEEEGLSLADIMASLYCIDKDIDVINVSTGGITYRSVNDYPGYQLSYAREIKNKFSKIVIGGGLLSTAEMGQVVVKEGIADLVYYGRLALKDPYFPLRFAEELKADIEWPKFYIRAKNI